MLGFHRPSIILSNLFSKAYNAQIRIKIDHANNVIPHSDMLKEFEKVFLASFNF